ncbi:hypothetical protein MMC18_006036, partial [Xylographa bjoerkii]|nr:hypothetical protein [Xylographa bjoerkii]
MKPITLFWRNMVPNPSKVLVILEELGLPYETSWVEQGDLKREPFTRYNPNGRVPVPLFSQTVQEQQKVDFQLLRSVYNIFTDPGAIIDPNTDMVLFESGAIVAYLIDTYDKENKLNYPSSPEKYQLLQWSFFQASGQGPYFGQAAWFNLFHPEKLPSAQTRYAKEIKRVISVLDASLVGRDWLVGDKCTYADLAFVMWNTQIDFVMAAGTATDEKWDVAEFPNFKRWQEAMLGRESLKRVLSVLQEKEVKSEGK